MAKNKPYIKLICLSNAEKNQTRRLDLLAFLHLLTHISPTDLELKSEVTKSKWGTFRVRGKEVKQMTRKTQVLNYDPCFSSSASAL